MDFRVAIGWFSRGSIVRHRECVRIRFSGNETFCGGGHTYENVVA